MSSDDPNPESTTPSVPNENDLQHQENINPTVDSTVADSETGMNNIDETINTPFLPEAQVNIQRKPIGNDKKRPIRLEDSIEEILSEVELGTTANSVLQTVMTRIRIALSKVSEEVYTIIAERDDLLQKSKTAEQTIELLEEERNEIQLEFEGEVEYLRQEIVALNMILDRAENAEKNCKEMCCGVHGTLKKLEKGVNTKDAIIAVLEAKAVQF